MDNFRCCIINKLNNHTKCIKWSSTPKFLSIYGTVAYIGGGPHIRNLA
jgi:hypothetical protein